MSKTYVIDTNVLLHDPKALFVFDDNTVVITEYVLYELDEKKKGNEEINHNAREACRQIDIITEGLSTNVIQKQTSHQEELPLGTEYNVSRPVNIPGTPGKLVILMDDPNNPVNGETRDDKILALVHRHRKDFQTPIIVVTKDTLMGIKALGIGFGRQNYRRDRAKTQLRQLPTLTAVQVPVDKLFEWEVCHVPGILAHTYPEAEGKERRVAPGYYVLDYGDGKMGLIHLNRHEEVRLISKTPNICRSTTNRGVRAKNLEQSAAMDALLNKDKTLVCLMGPAGIGKTLLAIAAAVHTTRGADKTASNGESAEEDQMTRKERKQRRKQHQTQRTEERSERTQIYITRPMVSMGNEMGFLPGGVEEKMNPWMQPIYDNLNYILGPQTAERMVREGTIQLQPLQFIRGRSLHNAILIVDESQNLTPHEIKTIITRAGQGTRVILTGDPDQIDNPYIDKLSNGLTYAADRLGLEDFAAVVPLVQGERSPMSAKAAELL